MKIITAEELDEKFDNNDDISEYMDFSKAQKLTSVLNQQYEECEDVHIYFPKNLLKIMDSKIKDIGINREAFIKMVIAEKLNIIETQQTKKTDII
ncbi:hypothetical protein QUF50_06205 [Thiotrichales bacterium HSG1]|nr:hypothetical protein [Thiotrichales bacterium HSG1]